MADVFGVRIRGISLANDAPSHQRPHTFDEHFPLNTKFQRQINIYSLTSETY